VLFVSCLYAPQVSLGCQILIALVFPLALMATGSFWAGAALLVFMVLVGLLLWHRRQQVGLQKQGQHTGMRPRFCS
jgi:membrane protein implicated in regulation of membrane protease activity